MGLVAELPRRHLPLEILIRSGDRGRRKRYRNFQTVSSIQVCVLFSVAGVGSGVQFEGFAVWRMSTEPWCAGLAGGSRKSDVQEEC